MASVSFAGQLPQQTYGVLQYFPIISSPAIKKDGYDVDEIMIGARTISGVALSLIAKVGLCWICPPFALFVAKHDTLAILGSVVLPCTAGIFEVWKACNAADQLVAQEYGKPVPSSKVTDHLSSNPRAFQRLLSRKEGLNKLDRQGETLARKILFSGRRFSEVTRMLVDSMTGTDLLTVDENGVSFFMLVLKESNYATLRYILETGKVQAENISKQDQVKIWKRVNNANKIRLLCQYGFDINARDDEENTPLMHWAQIEKLFSNGIDRKIPACSIAALNAKANPLLENKQGKKASQIVPEGSLLKSLLLQAEKEFQSNPISLPKEKGLMAWLPWRPLVYKDSFSFRFDLDASMTSLYCLLVAVAALIFFLPNSTIEIYTKICTGTTVFSVLFIFTQLWRGQKEAERQAVVEFLANPVPSKQSTTTISGSTSAARLLFECSPNDDTSCLNKLDEEGMLLLTKYGVDPEVFKFLVNKGADIFFSSSEESGFSKAVQNSDPALLAHILDQEKVKIQDVSTKLQMKMWSSVGSKETALLLKEHGFDPNVKDENGDTALIHLVRGIKSVKGVPLGKLEWLLEVGADLNLQNSRGETAKNLLPPEVAQLPQVARLIGSSD